MNFFSFHPYELLIGHKQIISKRVLKGTQILKFHILERYIEFLFFIQFRFSFFYVVEWIVLRAYGSMSTDFLYFGWFSR